MAVRIRTIGGTDVVIFAILCGLSLSGCGRAPAPPTPRASVATSATAILPPIELPQPSQRLGTAVVVLVDTSGSMAQPVADHSGRQRPKHEIARDALKHIVEITEAWHRQHQDTNLFLGVINFSGVTAAVLPMGPFD